MPRKSTHIEQLTQQSSLVKALGKLIKTEELHQMEKSSLPSLTAIALSSKL